MVTVPTNEPLSEPLALNESDRHALTQLVNAVALSDHALMLFAIAPESAPSHPVVEAFQARLKAELAEPLHFSTFLYSDDSLFNFLAARVALPKILPETLPENTAAGREVIFAFGLEQLPTPRKKQELEQLNLAREKLFEQNIIIVFWLNRESFLDEFRARASDFWDWRGKVAVFEARYRLLYPYLEWLVSTNSYLTMNGVMQVNRQVDIFLDQIYVSLQAERKQQVSASIAKGARVLASGRVSRMTALRSTGTSSIRSGAPDSVHKGFDGSREKDFADSLEPLPEPSFEVTAERIEIEASAIKTVTERVDLSEVVREPYGCSVILGAPGAGKTTLLKFLALHFAKAMRDGRETVPSDKDGESLGAVRLPIFFKIADYAERLEQHPALGLLNYLQQFYRQWETSFEGDRAVETDISVFLLEQMQLGNCLILLDGLDEVFDQESRRQIVGRINDFAERFGHNNKLIVTSRIAGYQELKLASCFAEFTITDMSDEQVSEFLQRWYRSAERAQRPDADSEFLLAGSRQAERVYQDIQQNDGIKRLTTNPLLLTILALIHRDGDQLPEHRVRLYGLAVKALTADWKLSKKSSTQRALLSENEIVALLAHTAYWMHEEKPSGVITHQEAVKQMTSKLSQLRNRQVGADEIQIIEKFLKRVRETTGLFVEKAQNAYGFLHLTFEEYFVARHIAAHDDDQVLEIIQSKISDPRWTDSILLALGFLNENFPQRSEILIETLFSDLIRLSKTVRHDRKSRYLSRMASKLIMLDSQLSKRLPNLGIVSKSIIIIVSRAPLFVLTFLYNLRIVLFHSTNSFQEGYFGSLLNLALKVIKNVDININKFQRLSLTKGLLFSYFLIENLKSGINRFNSPKIKRFDEILGFQKVRELLDRIEGFDKFISDFLSQASAFQDPELHSSIQKYLQLTVKNVLLIDSVRSHAQALFLRDFIEKGGCFEDDISKFLSLPPSARLSAIAYWQAGNIYSEKEMYSHSLYSYRQSLSLWTKLKDKVQIANLQGSISTCYSKWGKYGLALEMAEKNLSLAQQSRDQERMSQAYSQKSSVYQDWGKYEEAIAAQQQVLAIRKKLDDQPSIAYAYWRLGCIYQDWNKHELSIEHFQKSLSIWIELKNDQQTANLFYSISNCYRDWGKYEEAIAAQKQVLAIREKLDDPASIAVTYYQFGSIYQAWGKYEAAIAQHEQSRDRYQQLGKESNVANQWYWIADCYRDWGKYEEAIAAQQQELALREKLDDQPEIASVYFQFGRIYQDWGKYEEAIAQYEQSRKIYQTLALTQQEANQLSWLATCYRDLKDYAIAAEYYQKSTEQHQSIDHLKSTAQRLRQLAKTQLLQAKNSPPEQAKTHLQQADQNLQKAVQLNTAGDYLQNLAYDHIVLALLHAEHLRPHPNSTPTLSQHIAQFEQAATTASNHFAKLGQTLNSAEEALDIARAYLEIPPLQNLARAEEIAHQSLQTFQTLNRQKLQAVAYQLLGEIYLAPSHPQKAQAATIAHRFLTQSLELYQTLDIATKAAEVQQLRARIPDTLAHL